MSVKSWLIVMVFLLALTVAVTTPGSPNVLAKSDSTKTMETVKEIEVELHDDYFNPKVITIPSKSTTTLMLKNKGKREHTFTVKKLGIDVELQPGEEKTVTVEPQQPGTYELICRYHAREGMVGKVVIE